MSTIVLSAEYGFVTPRSFNSIGKRAVPVHRVAVPGNPNPPPAQRARGGGGGNPAERENAYVLDHGKHGC